MLIAPPREKKSVPVRDNATGPPRSPTGVTVSAVPESA
jgi:hypothetical protein